MEFEKLMKERYSVRKFDSGRKIPQSAIDELLEAVYLAPTAENKQPLRVWTITDDTRLPAIQKVTKYHYHAPLTIAIGYCPDEAWVREYDQKNYGIVDASIAAMQLWLRAEDIGLGAVWVSSFDPEKLRELFPEMKGAEIVALMQLGYADDNSRPAAWHYKKRERKDMFFTI